MAKAYTVSQVNTYIKNMFEQDFLLNDIVVSGEVSNCKYHTTGHIYFTLKDSEGTMAAVMFKGNTLQGLKFRLSDGQKVLVRGGIKVYERDGKYQLYARTITIEGEGDLYKRFLELKAELEEMGMFAPEYKKPIKRFSKRVGIVTAKTGAAIQDIINISKRRNPYVELVLYPAIVQGKEAAPSIIKGITILDEMKLDVIIVGRGGGSIEDLWAFNEESVARAIFNCETPVISAVGHETDFTIADFVADLRASTPSAAAELAVCNIENVEQELNNYKYTLQNLMLNKCQNVRDKMSILSTKLSFLSPLKKLEDKKLVMANLENRLVSIMGNVIITKKNVLAIRAERLNGLSPLKKLSQGYSLVCDDSDKLVNSVKQVKEKDNITIQVLDGSIKAVVSGITHSEIDR